MSGTGMPHTMITSSRPSWRRLSSYGLASLGVLIELTGCTFEVAIELDQQAETFVQAPLDQVDVLWVIDDTATMAGAQEQLIEQFGSFAEVLDGAGIGYQMEVVTTSSGPWDGEGWSPDTSDEAIYTAEWGSAGSFAERLRVGTSGSDKERGLSAALLALTVDGGEPPEAPRLVREDADLLVVFVTDEDDCSDDGALSDDSPTSCYTSQERLVPVGEIVEALIDVHDDVNRVLVAGILGTEASGCPDVYPGTRYQRVARATGGWVADICGEDWSGALERLGAHATGLRDSFRLQRAAEPGSVAVYVDQLELFEDPQEGFTYDPETWLVRFAPDAVPARGATIRIEYVRDMSRFVPAY